MADNRTGAPIKSLTGEYVNTKISDGTDVLGVNADGSLNAVVTATDLDIRNLAPATDKVAIGDGTHDLDVNADGSLNAVVSATNLDIRDLTAASDFVGIKNGANQLAINVDGSVNAVVTEAPKTPVVDFEKATAVAQDATYNFDYVTTNTKTFTGNHIKVGCAGACKVEVGYWNGVDTFTVVETFFQQPSFNFDHSIAFLKQVGDGTIGIRIAVTNLDDARDIYCTIYGGEV